ncbi:MAG: hypothetical protein ABIN44_11610 [Burkholderiaceae bacterium]
MWALLGQRPFWPTTAPATTAQPSTQGDVLHARPAVVNYGGSVGIVVFYGAVDGMPHAINGNQTGSGAGGGLWSFVPEKVFGKLNRLRTNSPLIRLPTTTYLTATPRSDFIDGLIGMYLKTNASNGSDRGIIYVGMRRGGRQFYAFDVTSPTAPRFLRKKIGCAADAPLLGQAGSEPKIACIRGNSTPVVIIDGGYAATAKDVGSRDVTTTGNAVYVLEAFTATVLKRFTALSSGSISGSIGADVAERVYAVDLGAGGSIDFETRGGGYGASDWNIHEVADLSGGTTPGRKCSFPPDVIVTRDFTAMTFGSGDHEKPPLSTTDVHFSQILDRHLAASVPANGSPSLWTDFHPVGAASDVSGSGCHMSLAQGEKGVNGSTSIVSLSYFGTNRPWPTSAGNVCSANLGFIKSYAMPLFCVAGDGSVLSGGGLCHRAWCRGWSRWPVPRRTKQVPFVIGARNPSGSAIQASRLRPSVNAPPLRRSWHQEVKR